MTTAVAPPLPQPRPPEAGPRPAEDAHFLELRRKVRDSELLSAATQRLLARVRFHGRLTVIVHDGRILKSGYEEGYFRCKTSP